MKKNISLHILAGNIPLAIMSTGEMGGRCSGKRINL